MEAIKETKCESLEFENHKIRMVLKDEEPWFCASDVCKALGYKNRNDAMKRHCRAKGVVKRDTLTDGGIQGLTFIDEGNLYRLILKSNLPAAEKFEEWVCDEVLPTIRRTGSYNPSPMRYLVSDNKSLGTDFTNLMLRELLKVDSRPVRTRMAGLIDFYVSQIK